MAETGTTLAEIIYKDLSYQIQGAFFEVWRSLGNAHKETIYQKALEEQLKLKGLTIESQRRINIYFNETKVGNYVPDLIVNDSILIELKCKTMMTRSDIQQFWHYLRATEYKVGYLVNFGGPRLHIIRRVYDTARRKHLSR